MWGCLALAISGGGDRAAAGSGCEVRGWLQLGYGTGGRLQGAGCRWSDLALAVGLTPAAVSRGRVPGVASRSLLAAGLPLCSREKGGGEGIPLARAACLLCLYTQSPAQRLRGGRDEGGRKGSGRGQAFPPLCTIGRLAEAGAWPGRERAGPGGGDGPRESAIFQLCSQPPPPAAVAVAPPRFLPPCTAAALSPSGRG